MARNYTATLTAGAWTQLTDADVSSITFQNKSGYHIFVAGTTGATAPTDFDDAIRYNPGQGERNATLSDLFPGIAAVRVYAFCQQAASVFVSHA